MIGGGAGVWVGAGAGAVVGVGTMGRAVVGGAGAAVVAGAGAAVVVGAVVVAGAVVVSGLEPGVAGAADEPERSMTSPRTLVGLSSEHPTRPASATVTAIASRAMRRWFPNISLSLSPW